MKVHNHADGNRDVLGAPSVLSDTVGRGKVTIYRDGTKITGTWRRTKASGPLRFTDDEWQDHRAQARQDLGAAQGLILLG